MGTNEKIPTLQTLLFFNTKGMLDERFEWTKGKSKNDLSCIILADSQHICRAVYYGKMTKKQIKNWSIWLLIYNMSLTSNRQLQKKQTSYCI